MKAVGVLRFPGTNCDRDVFGFVEAKKLKAQYLWHLDQFNPKDFEALVIPGGFSYGDYLRSGALAAVSPAMKSVKEFAELGGPILGICNGFQILCEAKLLPGALVKNEGRRFIDDWVELEVMNKNQRFNPSQKNLKLPIAHGDGRFYAPENELKKIQDNNQVWMKYKNENPNGSLQKIAGVMNENKNVAALMPHPERAIYDWMGSTDGWGFL